MSQHTFSLFRTSLCSLLLMLGCASAVNAQFKASVQGTVSDTAGGIVPGATVTLTSKETNKTQTVTTSDEGFYRFNQLAPGSYRLSAEQTGFKKQVLENVIVSAEDTQGIDLALSVGAVSEVVTVTETSVQPLETETANIRGVITRDEVIRLPQVGRNPYELARTAPGVFGDTARSGTGNQAQFIPGTEQLGGGSNTGVFQTENQTQISANGQRVSSNNYLVDGVSVNSLGLGGAAVVTPNQESVKEVAVVTSSYSAEDGRNTGAQVKVVSQNGTNEFHGSAVINYASPKLNAFNKYYGSAAQPRAPTRVEQYERKFAGSLGGPVYLPRFGEGGSPYWSGKDKLFFFVSYEGLRRSNTNVSDVFIETPEFADYVQRTRPGSFAARLFATAGVRPRVIATGLQTGGPAGPNRAVNGSAGLSFDIGSITAPPGQNVNTTVFDGIPDVTLARVAIPSSTRGNQYNTRIDYNFNAKNQFALSTYFTKLNTFSGSASGRPFEDIAFKPFNSAATFTYLRTISANMLNEARANFTRFNANELADLGTGDLSIPRLQVQGFGTGFSFGGAPSFGIDRGRPNTRTQNTYEFRDTLTWVRGNQALKFGGEARLEQNNNNEVAEARPEFVFKSLLDLANDSVFFENVAVDPRTGGSANGQRYFRSRTYGAFVQDDWKFRPNLTLNLGIRYEYQTPLTEKEGRLTNYVFGPNGLVDGRVVPVNRLYNPDRNNFAPRLGFAYSPNYKGLGGLFGENRAVIRGGFGISYDRIFENLLTQVRGNTPFFARASLCCARVDDLSAPAGDRNIIYSFALGGNPFLYPVNPRLQSGIDPVTGGLLAASPQTLPGGFIRRDVPVEINGTPSDLPNAYVYSYSLELQYQLTPKTVTAIGYQGSTGHKLIRTIDLNRLMPGDTFDLNRDRVQTADARGNPVTPRLTGNPNFDRIFFPLPDVNSNYNALILRLTRQYARGLSGEAVYRWSKSIDTSSFGRGTQQDFPIDQRLDRGPSDFDIRHNLIASVLWDLPFFRTRHGALNKLLGGFQLNGILDLHSGFPFTPIVFAPDNADTNGDGILPDRPTQYFGGVIRNPSNQDFINGIFGNRGPAIFGVFPDCNNFPIRCFNSIVRGAPGIGRNSFRGPRYRSVDLSVVKQTRLPGFLGERSNLELRANMFNAFNLLNLPSFQPATDQVNVANQNFGRATFGLAGRIIELQARFSF